MLFSTLSFPFLLYLDTESQKSLALDLLEVLRQAGLLRVADSKDELCVKLPILWQAPLCGDLLVDDGVVVLEVGAEAFGLESGPEDELVHGVGLLCPVAELVGVGWVGFLLGLDGWAVGEEENLLKMIWLVLVQRDQLQMLHRGGMKRRNRNGKNGLQFHMRP